MAVMMRRKDCRDADIAEQAEKAKKRKAANDLKCAQGSQIWTKLALGEKALSDLKGKDLDAVIRFKSVKLKSDQTKVGQKRAAFASACEAELAVFVGGAAAPVVQPGPEPTTVQPGPEPEPEGSDDGDDHSGGVFADDD